MTEKVIRIGRWYTFRYAHDGTPDLHPDYTAHNNHRVQVLRELVAGTERDVDSSPAFEVKALDGWTGTAVDDELR